MPSRPTMTAPQDLPDIDPEEMMAGSPFAIPPNPTLSRQTLALVMEKGDFGAFVIALGLIFGLVSLIGISVLPNH